MSTYAALWAKSNFSFLEGASHPEELVERAADLGLGAIALTDRDGLYGAVRAHQQASRLGLRLILGAEVTLQDDSTIVLLVVDRDGYRNLCRLLTSGRLRSEKGQCRVSWSEVSSHARGLLALWGGSRSLLTGRADPHLVARDLQDAFGDRLYAMTARHYRAEELHTESLLRERASRYGWPVVAANEVLYHQRSRRRLQDVLTCTRHGVSLSGAGTRTRPNAEHDLKAPVSFTRLFADDPTAVHRSLDIAERCSFSLDSLRYRYPAVELSEGGTSAGLLRRLTFEGAQRRYGVHSEDSIPTEVRLQLERELELIEELDYPGYFLTMHEIVEFCRDRGILCQGRGSAANSAVCFCLGITAVDPVRMDLLFERFLSRERNEPPDIDLDIAHERREEVIQHVYERYGRDHAAMVANVVRYRSRSAIRDVGKALDIPATTLDRLARLASHHADVDACLLEQGGLASDSDAARHLLDLCAEIQDFPRHLSIHPGGFLLGHEPVCDIVPIENASMSERTVIQWDKDDIEALGLFKVDLLALGALTQLDKAFTLIRRMRGVDLSMATIPADDPETYEMICMADTVGVFQIESRAQMAMLPRLAPRTFYDLVIEVSIVRPGPIAGGMVHPYLRRRAGLEPVEYAHECLRPVLERTLGVPIFQEQVMRLAILAADYTPGEADQLRRDMAAWRRTGRIEKHRERLVSRMRAKGIEAEFAERVFEQIRGFGEYGFPESHAASFALIAYATAWLRRHYPVEFTCALLASQPMGFYSPSTIVEDARRHGVEILPVSVTHSLRTCSSELTERDFGVRMGLDYIKGLTHTEAQAIVEARTQAPFHDLEDFVRRCRPSRKALKALAEAGALTALEPDRRQALWRVLALVGKDPPSLPLPQPDRRGPLDPLDRAETIAWDHEKTGHSPRGHPLSPLREELRRRGLPTAGQVAAMRDGRSVDFVGLVICRQRPGTASGVVFMTLEDETGFANVIVWPSVFERHSLLARTCAFLGVSGIIQAAEGVVHVVAHSLWEPRTRIRPTETASRDFH